MPQLYDKQSNKKWTVLGVGSPGVGKTPSLLSIAEKGEVKIFDFDDRLDSTKEFYTKICPRPNIIRNIDYTVVKLDNFKDFMKEWEDLQDNCPYYAVMLDSISSMSVTSITWQIRMKLGSGGTTKLKLSGGKTGIPVPDWPEFNGEANLLCSVLEVGKTIPAHFIVTAHPMNRTAIDGKGTVEGARRYTSLVSAGVKGVDLIPNYFNEIWKFEVIVDYTSGERKEKHVIHTQKLTSDDLAKTTCGLPEEVDITNKPLFEVVNSFLKI